MEMVQILSASTRWPFASFHSASCSAVQREMGLMAPTQLRTLHYDAPIASCCVHCAMGNRQCAALGFGPAGLSAFSARMASCIPLKLRPQRSVSHGRSTRHTPACTAANWAASHHARAVFRSLVVIAPSDIVSQCHRRVKMPSDGLCCCGRCTPAKQSDPSKNAPCLHYRASTASTGVALLHNPQTICTSPYSEAACALLRSEASASASAEPVHAVNLTG